MAFGNGPSTRTHLFRQIAVGVGVLTLEKEKALALLRETCLRALSTFADAGWLSEPLLEMDALAAIRQRLLLAQNSFSGLNSAYLEKCRLHAQTLLLRECRQYFGKLLTGLRECERLPLSCRALTADEAQALTQLGAVPKEAWPVFKDLLTGAYSGWSAPQVEVLRQIHANAQASRSSVRFDSKELVLSVPLDYRLLPATWKDMPGTLQSNVASLLQDPDNARYTFFLDISPAQAKTARIRLPLTLPREQFLRLAYGGAAAHIPRGLTLLLGPTSTEVRMSVTRPKTAPTSGAPRGALVTRVWGADCANGRIEVKQLVQPWAQCPSPALKSLADNHLLTGNPGAPSPVLASWSFDNKEFTRRIVALASKIDVLGPRIDHAYALLNTLGLQAQEELGHPAGELLEPHNLSRKAVCAQKWLHQWAQVQTLKRARKRLYKKIAALQKCWCGFLANKEAGLAVKWDAAALEDVPIGQSRSFKRAGAGASAFAKVSYRPFWLQYERTVRKKHEWNGVPLFEHVRVALPPAGSGQAGIAVTLRS